MENKIIMWEIGIFCNFNCPYCWLNHPKIYDIKIKDNFSKIKGFLESIKNSTISISGGEPFLYPKFTEICKVITKNNNTLFIFTNLSSKNIYEFGNIMNPKMIGKIRASLHLTEIKKYEEKVEFIKKYKFLKEKGFNIDVSVVMWPPIFKKFDSIYKEFESIGINIIPIVFRGKYKEKIYPNSYTKKEFKIIKHYFNITNKKYFNGKYSGIGELNERNLLFKGKLCLTGKDYFVIDRNGDIKRCLSSFNKIGNIYEGKVYFKEHPTICENDECFCPGEGLRNCLEPKNTSQKKSINILKKIIKEIKD